MKILGIEHLGIAVEDLAQGSPFWKHVLNMDHVSTEVVADQGVTTDIYDTGKGKVELLEAENPDSPIAKFLEKRGPGIHHVCLEVDNLNIASLDHNDLEFLQLNSLLERQLINPLYLS